MNAFLHAAMERAQQAHEKRLADARDLDALPDQALPRGRRTAKPTTPIPRQVNAHGLGRGVPPPASTCIAVQRARRDGVDIDQLAERFGVSTRTIQRLLKRAALQEAPA